MKPPLTTRLLQLAIAISLSGCALPQHQLTPDDLLQLAPVRCETADQCGKMWQRAQLWVAKNAGFKIQIANDVVIETFNPSKDSTWLAFTVYKEPVGGGAYLINSRAACDNFIGCFPPPDKGRAALHRYIRDTPQ